MAPGAESFGSVRCFFMYLLSLRSQFFEEEQMNVYLKNLAMDLRKGESGQDIVEYALLGAVIALGCVAAMSTIATAVSTIFATVGTKITTNVT